MEKPKGRPKQELNPDKYAEYVGLLHEGKDAQEAFKEVKDA